MKFKNILILEDLGCDDSKCDGGFTTCAGQTSKCEKLKNDPDFIVCVNRGTQVAEKFCKKKVHVITPPTPSPGKKCSQPEDCPADVVNFLTWYWKDKKWVDASGNPDSLKHPDQINGVNLKADGCVSSTFSRNFEDAKKRYTTTHKCVAGPTKTEGLKRAYSENKEKYLKTVSPTIIDDPDASAKEECTKKGGTFDPKTKECKMPINPGVQNFRIEFDTKFGGLVDKFKLDPEQWDRMYDTMPETYPPTSFSVLSAITKNIVSYIEDFYASSEFGIFKQVLDTFVELYSNKVDEKGTVTDDKSKILDPSFFKRFGGTVDEVKQLSTSIETVNNVKITKLNYNSLMDPEASYQNMFSQKIVTVLASPESYFTKPLKMYAWKKNSFGALPKIDLTPIDNVLKSEITEKNCETLLDTFGYYKSNPLIPRQKIEEMVTMGQTCLCKNKFMEIGKLTGKDKFSREKKELAKKRLGILNNMGVSKLNC